MTSASQHDPYQSLRVRDFRLLLLGNSIATFGEQMLTLALGWELYLRTGSAFLLGMVGLAEIFPHCSFRSTRARLPTATIASASSS